jgi:hypothetical protein
MGSLYRLGSLAPSLADKARETALAEILGRLWGCAIVHMGDFARVDWQVLQNGVEIGCAELKFRDKPFGHYPDGMLPLDRRLIRSRQATVAVLAIPPTVPSRS